jgi:hypothetical protein
MNNFNCKYCNKNLTDRSRDFFCSFTCSKCCNSEVDVDYVFLNNILLRINLINIRSKISLTLYFSSNDMYLQNFNSNSYICFDYLDNNINPLNFKDKIRMWITFK